MLPVLLTLSLSAAFSWPPRYTLIGTWSIPYTNVSNPITVVHEPTRQYQNQLNGAEQIWSTTAEEHFYRKLVLNGTDPFCFGVTGTADSWDVEIPQFLPDADGYTTQPGLFSYRGRLARLHTRTEPGGKTQTWKVYTDPDTGAPLGYIAHAKSLMDSHYDVYELSIDKFVPDVLPGAWVLPVACQGSALAPLPSAADRFSLFLPGKSDASAANRQKLIGKGRRPFTHLTPAQFVARMKRGKRRTELDPEDICVDWDGANISVDLPAEFSWRNVSSVVGPVRDQVACGSCWAFGTAETIEAQLALKTGIARPISVNQIMDCTWDNQNYACDGGEVNWALTSMKNKSLGIAYESDYPYLGVGGVCDSNSANYEIAGYVNSCFHIAKTREAVKKALWTFGPLSIGIAVTEKMLLYADGVFDDPTCIGIKDNLDHAVVLTGWRVIDGKEAWEVKNSWSTHWGWDGYIYIQSAEQEWNCGVTTDAVAVLVDQA